MILGLAIATGVLALVVFSSKYKWWQSAIGRQYPRILMYHMVHEHRPNTRFNGLRVPPAEFEKQLQWLKTKGFDFYLLSELMAQPKVPHNAVVITFDDGYEDNYSLALPLLKKYSAKATLFLVEERFDNDWSVKKKAHHASGELKQEPKLSDEQVREMIASGCFEIGGHSLTHANFGTLNTEQKRHELQSSKTLLEQKFGIRVSTYAYPFGIYDEEDQHLVREAGYDCAVTTEEGIDQDIHQARYDLRRIKVSGRKNFLYFKISMRMGLSGLF